MEIRLVAYFDAFVNRRLLFAGPEQDGGRTIWNFVAPDMSYPFCSF